MESTRFDENVVMKDSCYRLKDIFIFSTHYIVGIYYLTSWGCQEVQKV